MRRFVVTENSMVPTLHEGDGLVGVRSKRVRRGQLRVFEHPARPDFWLVKRVGRVVGADGSARFEARSDSDAAGVVDSRHFGLIDASRSYRVVLTARQRRS